MAANWKMHKTVLEAISYIEALHSKAGSPNDREVLVIPPFTSLFAVKDAIAAAGYKLGAQNCYFEDKGSYTGEVAVPMLAELDCAYVVAGHSERRHIFGETDETVGKKVGAVLRGGLKPILCLGELLEERERGETFEVVKRQLEQGLAEVAPGQEKEVVVAYEPVWAIGTGKTATPDQAQEAHAYLREELARRFDKTIANEIRILYGGSVKPDNVDELMALEDIDGALVGGASLEADSFGRIVLYR
jgi:triosephosphate isomerase